MSVLEYSGGQVETDEEGYLANYGDWNEDVAAALAVGEGVEQLTDEMLSVIRFMRDYYEKYESFPILGTVCKNVSQPKGCVQEEFIDPLAAWKIAGLPKPGEEVLAYLQPARDTI